MLRHAPYTARVVDVKEHTFWHAEDGKLRLGVYYEGYKVAGIDLHHVS